MTRCDVPLARHPPAGDLVGDLVVLLRLEVPEREVLELPLDLPDAESIGQRRVDLHRLLRDAPTLARRPELERPHVVQAVGQLDEHDADVLGHGQEHLAHVLGPQVLAVQLRGHPRLIALDVEALHLVELGDAVDQAGDFATEAALELGHRHAAVLGHVVQERRDDRGRVEMDAGQRLGDGQRMIDVRLTRLAHLWRMGLGREGIGALDGLDVGRRQVPGDLVKEALGRSRSRRRDGRGHEWSESLSICLRRTLSSAGAARAAP